MNTLDLLKDSIIKYLPFDNIDEAKDYVYNYLVMNGVTDVPSKNSSKFKKLIEYLQNELGSLTKGRRKVNLVLNADSLWIKLVELGYSEGDIINSDDISEAANELGMDLDKAMNLIDEIEEAYNVTISSNDTLIGADSDNDSSANVRMQDDTDYLDIIWNNLEDMGYGEGDVIITEDIITAGGDLDDDDLENMLTEYGVIVLDSVDVGGDGPGDYYELD